MLQERDDIVALDSAIIQHPQDLGDLGPPRGLHRPAGRLQDLQEALPRRQPRERSPLRRASRPSTRARHRECELTEPREFNLMFKTLDRPGAGRRLDVYLRPETAQGIFLNFKNVLQFARRKPPFGIAQVGKSFRNEITPGNFIFRTLEFEQMEMEFFVRRTEAAQWYDHWKRGALRLVHRSSACAETTCACATHDDDELSHYSYGTARRGVPLPHRLVGAGGHRQPRRLRPERHTPRSRAEPRDRRATDGRALRPARHRAGRRHRPQRCSRSSTDAYDEEDLDAEQPDGAAATPASSRR